MILYHGTNIDFNVIDLDKSNKYKDFGQGFYLTDIRSQAEELAAKKSRLFGGYPVVQEYEFDENIVNDYFVKLSTLLKDVPIGWLYNIDETGQQDFVDSREIYVVVPKDMDTKNLKYPVDRNGKRSTVIHCICSDGTFLRPLFVLPRKTIDAEVFDMLDPSSVLFDYSPTGFVNYEVFCKSFLTDLYVLHQAKIFP